ncbi:alpha-N-acetylgalactosaminidase [Rhyzopertha dominica]|nr:alpha-N-acetylgalactosaminidase [Rhyzopertha dominica]
MNFAVVGIVLVILGTFLEVTTLDNGLALTPPMGWMAWQRFRCLVDCDTYPDECISENLFRTMADLMVSDGYLDVGYEYIMIDDCWASKERDESDRLVPDPDRFPSGIKALADYVRNKIVHSRGLKLGIYGDFGTKTCAGYPGSLDYLEIDANTFAEWGADYLKFDGCYSGDADFEEGYAKMGEYLNKTGRPIVYSCSWPAYEEPLGIKYLWRNWDDIDDAWSNVTNILGWFSKHQDRIAPFSGPGHWNDPDMLLIGNYGLSYEQSKAQMAIWAIMAAPLIMSVDLRTISPIYRDILLNKQVISINQDKLGIQGKLVKSVKKIDIWTKPIEPVVNGSYTYAVGFLSNRVDGYKYKLDVVLGDIGLNHTEGYLIQNIYDPQAEYFLKPEDKFEVRVKPSGK